MCDVELPSKALSFTFNIDKYNMLDDVYEEEEYATKTFKEMIQDVRLADNIADIVEQTSDCDYVQSQQSAATSEVRTPADQDDLFGKFGKF